MPLNSIPYAVAFSLTAIIATPLAGFSMQPARYNSNSGAKSILALILQLSPATHQKQKIMTNLASAQHPNFSGRWILDSKASDPLDEILKEQGASWLERQAAKNLKIVQDIKQDANQITITFETSLKSKTDVLKLDGSTKVSQENRIGTVKIKTFWAPDGMTLVTLTEPTDTSQNFKSLKLSRKIQDQGKTMAQLVEMQLKNGKILKANRILRKAN